MNKKGVQSIILAVVAVALIAGFSLSLSDFQVTGRATAQLCDGSNQNLDPFVAGYVTLTQGTRSRQYTDRCSLNKAGNTVVLQYFCDQSGNFNRQENGCQSGQCRNGACLQQAAAPLCTDSDNGIDLSTPGAITVTNPSTGRTSTFKDQCITSGKYDITETYCQGDFAQFKLDKCPQGTTCTRDSNGQGYCQQSTTNQTPSCVPTTCQAQNAQCGIISNGCGGTVNCGICPQGQTGAMCTNNRCQVVMPGIVVATNGTPTGLSVAATAQGVVTMYNTVYVYASASSQNPVATGALSPPGTAWQKTGSVTGLQPSTTYYCLVDGTTSNGQYIASVRTQCATLAQISLPVNQTNQTNQTPACVPTTCQAQNAQCGTILNGCGGTVNCGTCLQSGAICTNNRCQVVMAGIVVATNGTPTGLTVDATAQGGVTMYNTVYVYASASSQNPVATGSLRRENYNHGYGTVSGLQPSTTYYCLVDGTTSNGQYIASVRTQCSTLAQISLPVNQTNQTPTQLTLQQACGASSLLPTANVCRIQQGDLQTARISVVNNQCSWDVLKNCDINEYCTYGRCSSSCPQENNCINVDGAWYSQRYSQTNTTSTNGSIIPGPCIQNRQYCPNGCNLGRMQCL
ncbi:hypothetical protein COV18_07370 [Candidatus Woesearchaeota archaeon CG10_big_fil_rev_8_21_14_0_10_37_12]|nr:MAG: hypothetical protein COV18_07370 [Candidatus Woesearchaeota archaeon CG10_big_fil_rev_8_21_14_0_10_37_12]